MLQGCSVVVENKNFDDAFLCCLHESGLGYFDMVGTVSVNMSLAIHYMFHLTGICLFLTDGFGQKFLYE